MNYQACEYEHYHDNGDNELPTIEPAIWCKQSNTYLTGYKNIIDAEKHAKELNKNENK